MEVLIMWLIVWAAFGFFGYKIAQRKGRNAPVWAAVSVLLGIIGIIIIALVPKTEEKKVLDMVAEVEKQKRLEDLRRQLGARR
jgi:hypothetical protein